MEHLGLIANSVVPGVLFGRRAVSTGDERMELKKDQCPKCSGQMERGFMFDRSFTSDRVLRWVEGEPESGGATGLKLAGKKTIRISRTDK